MYQKPAAAPAATPAPIAGAKAAKTVAAPAPSVQAKAAPVAAAKPAAIDVVKAGATAEKKAPGTTAAQVLQMGADAKKGAKAAEPAVKEGKFSLRKTFSRYHSHSFLCIQ
jgi:hypothetical protein